MKIFSTMERETTAYRFSFNSVRRWQLRGFKALNFCLSFIYWHGALNMQMSMLHSMISCVYFSAQASTWSRVSFQPTINSFLLFRRRGKKAFTLSCCRKLKGTLNAARNSPKKQRWIQQACSWWSPSPLSFEDDRSLFTQLVLFYSCFAFSFFFSPPPCQQQGNFL